MTKAKKTKATKKLKNYCEVLYNCSKADGRTDCKFFKACDNDKKECCFYDKDEEICSSIDAWFTDALNTIYTIYKLEQLDNELAKEKMKEMESKKQNDNRKTKKNG